MTDNEIIKAFECCYLYDVMFCDKCPNKDTCGEIDVGESILDLINRQNEKIESLEKHELKEAMTFNSDTINRAISEALKEFAERLKALLPYDGMSPEGRFKFGRIKSLDIDNLLKEMG